MIYACTITPGLDLELDLWLIVIMVDSNKIATKKRNHFCIVNSKMT